MFNVGLSELLCFAVIAVLVLGPDKLPEAARFAGKAYGKIKRMIGSVQHEIDRELRLSELQNQMQQELQRVQALEQRLNAQIQQQGLAQDLSLNVASSAATTQVTVSSNTATVSAASSALGTLANVQPSEQTLKFQQPWTLVQQRMAKVWHPQFTATTDCCIPLAKSA